MSEATCLHCDKPAKTLGRCSGHYERLRLKGIDGGPLGDRQPRPDYCIYDPDCDRPVRAKGLCSTHYARVRSGSTYVGPVVRPGRVALPREQRVCRGCGCAVERLKPGIYVLCSDCAQKPRKPHRRYYGKTWQRARDIVRERDHFRCRSCGCQEGKRQHAVAHIVPFDVGLAAGWPESRIHHPANLLLLCPACHRAYDYKPGWAFDVAADCRPVPPDWSCEFRVTELVEYLVMSYPDEARRALAGKAENA